MENKDQDVDKDDSSASTQDQDDSNVGDDSGNESDKDKNFAKLRTKNEELVEKNKKLEDENAKLAGNRSLDDDEDSDSDDDKDDKSKKSTTEEVLFKRDLKEATRLWNKENSVSPEVWQKIKDKVSFTGEETQSEIKDKIHEAYQNIPEVRKGLDDNLKKEGRNEAMKQFQDGELDMSGGDDSGGDSGGSSPRFNQKTRKWARGLGLSEKELKEVDLEEDTSKDKILDPAYQDRVTED